MGEPLSYNSMHQIYSINWHAVLEGYARYGDHCTDSGILAEVRPLPMVSEARGRLYLPAANIYSTTYEAYMLLVEHRYC